MVKSLLIHPLKKIGSQAFYLLLLLFVNFSFAQSASKQMKVIGGVAEAYKTLFSASANRVQNVKDIEIPNGVLSMVVSEQTPEYIIGKIAENKSSHVFFSYENGRLEGKATIPNQHKAYNYYTDAQGKFVVEEVDINKVICVDYPSAPQQQVQAAEDNGKRSASVPLYNSLPGATAVMMLDFDGFNCTGQPWGTINAASANYSDAQIKTSWEIIAEDYRPYNVNVTTDESVFAACAKNRRRRCVITPTDQAADGAGGVSYIGVFSNGNDNDVAWTFNVNSARVSGETNSHELGHNVGLNHDGPSYYMGHSDKSWAPIMGASYDDKVGQWSKGEYTNADRKEDDVAIIGANVFGYRADEAGDNIVGAKAMVVASGGVVNAADNYGVITKAADLDVYKFDCGTGPLTLKVGTTFAQPVPNLDVLLKLTNASGTDVVPAVDDKTSMHATVTATITTAGTYYLHIDGTGKDNPLNTGYSDYASIGEYTISGNIPLPTNVSEINNSVSFKTFPNPTSGQVFISIGNPDFRNEVRVTNMVGEVIYNMVTNSGQAIVDFTNHAQGIYFISVTNSFGTTTVKQIVE